MMENEFKKNWLKKLTDGSVKRQRYGLSSSDKGSVCVMGAARSTAVKMGMLPDEDLTGRDLLTDEELGVIGISKETQFMLSTMNDTYVATSKDKFPMRVINAVQQIPARERVPLLIENKKEKV